MYRRIADRYARRGGKAEQVRDFIILYHDEIHHWRLVDVWRSIQKIAGVPLDLAKDIWQAYLDWESGKYNQGQFLRKVRQLILLRPYRQAFNSLERGYGGYSTFAPIRNSEDDEEYDIHGDDEFHDEYTKPIPKMPKFRPIHKINPGHPHEHYIKEAQTDMGEDQLRKSVVKLAHDKPELRRHLVPLLKEAKGWSKLPKGWTEESLKKFFTTLTDKEPDHPWTACYDKIKGKVDNPEAFCGSIKSVAIQKGWWKDKKK
jgi:hypothetical protein